MFDCPYCETKMTTICSKCGFDVKEWDEVEHLKEELGQTVILEPRDRQEGDEK